MHNIYAMKIQNYQTQVNPFSGISLVNYHFNKSGLSELIDNELGIRSKYFGYQYNQARVMILITIIR